MFILAQDIIRPSRVLLAQSQQWKHQNNTWNLL